MEHKACIFCGNSSLIRLTSFQRNNLAKCSKCRLVFARNIPSEKELYNHYKTYSYSVDKNLSASTKMSYGILLKELEEFKTTGKLLDIGCGLGHFLVEAMSKGWDAYGTEFSERALELTRNKGLQTYKDTTEIPHSIVGKLDIVTSFEVLEHINNPNLFLLEVNRVLRPGGVFYCTTPNFNYFLRYFIKENYHVISYPEHLTYYTRNSLRNVTKSHGLKEIKFLSTGISLPNRKLGAEDKYTCNNNLATQESVRSQFYNRNYLRTLKKVINGILTITNKGLTLKGYFIKTSG